MTEKNVTMMDIVMIAHITGEKVNQVIKMQITGKALKPCPFCGGNNISLWEECVDFMNFKDYIYMVECNRCNAKIKRYSVTGVKRAWNRRTPESMFFARGYRGDAE